jgi:phage tail sheath gpL-like
MSNIDLTKLITAADKAAEAADALRAAVNAERDRRIVAGKTINGVAVTGRDEDARNLTNLALVAQVRIASGDTATLTTFRDGNNTDHDLTPAEMLALWQGSAAYVSALYAASWVIKALDPIPADYDADARWPAV